MKRKITFALLLTIAFFLQKAKAINHVDSLRIICWQYNVERESPISRYDFTDVIDEIRSFQYLQKDSLAECYTYSDISVDSMHAYVDTLIKSSAEIKFILSEIKRLEKVRELPFSSNVYLEEARYDFQIKEVVWIPVTPLDCQMLIVLFKRNLFTRNKQKKIDLIWLDLEYVETGKYRYKISDNLRKTLSKYTHLYDSFLK